MKHAMLLVYGAGVYALLVATVIYAVAFLGNLAVARTIDAAPAIAVSRGMLLDVALLLLFGLQHGGMARPGFRRWLSGIVGPAAERSTCVLLSVLTLIALMLLWQPIGRVVWSVENAPGRYAILGLYFCGWGLMIWASFLLDHFAMVGLRQIWSAVHERAPCRAPALRTPSAYRYVRHPVCTGSLVVLWAAPVMTLSHLVLSVGMSVCVIVAARLEERELQRRMPGYRQYRRKVPMLLPSWRKRLAPDSRAS